MMTGSGGGGNNKWTDEQEWERKKAFQKAMMARGKGPDTKGLGNGALSVSGIGSYAQKQASQGIAEKPVYPSPADLPKYNSLAEKQQAQKDAFNNIQQPGFGMGYSVKPTVAPTRPNGILDQEVAAARGSNPQPSVDDIQPIYQEDASAGGISKGDGGGKRPALSVDNNAAVAQPLPPQTNNSNARGFRVMAPPRKAYGEDSRRAALAMDIKPYKNGMGLTTGQVALKNSILNGDDERYANEQYQGQLSAAQKMAQEGMQQAGANSRAELSERGANTRASQRLGFDSDKFQQVAALDKRKLDMQQQNDTVKNFGIKRLNDLYSKYDAAESDEDRSAIAAQINSINGTKSDKEYWTNIGGGETLSADGLTSIKNPDILLNRNTGETRAIPAEPIDYETDPRAQAIINDRSLSKDERRKQLEALR